MDVETKHYSDGTRATGTAPLPAMSPDQQDALAVRLRETVARGYCDDKNSHKVLDGDLLHSIVHEILLSLAPDCHPSRRLPLALIH